MGSGSPRGGGQPHRRAEARLAPPLLEEILKRCLAKDREERWQTARDLKRQLEWVASGNPVPVNAITAPPPPAANARAQMLRLGLGMLAAAVLAAIAVGWARRPKAPAPAVVARFEMELPDGQDFTARIGIVRRQTESTSLRAGLEIDDIQIEALARSA